MQWNETSVSLDHSITGHFSSFSIGHLEFGFLASSCKASPKALLVCNGYKDEEYVSLALTARRLDFNCVIVLEQEEELDVVLSMSQKLSVRPVIGV